MKKNILFILSITISFFTTNHLSLASTPQTTLTGEEGEEDSLEKSKTMIAQVDENSPQEIQKVMIESCMSLMEQWHGMQYSSAQAKERIQNSMKKNTLLELWEMETWLKETIARRNERNPARFYSSFSKNGVIAENIASSKTLGVKPKRINFTSTILGSPSIFGEYRPLTLEKSKDPQPGKK